MRPVSSLCGATLVFLYVIGCCTSDQGTLFNRHPEPLDAPLDDEVYFECSLNLPADKFAWRHRPLNSKEWSPLLQTPNSGSKTSRHVVDFDNESKAGDYRCIAYYGTRGLASEPARLSLSTMDKFSDKGVNELRVSVGNTIPITCPVPYSCPEAIVQFYKDNELLERVNLAGDKTMVIVNAKVSDSGQYHCVATNYITNQASRSNFGTSLTVFEDKKFEAPHFVKQPQTEYKVLPGKNVTLECFAVGNPVPQMTWSRLGGSLPSRARYTSVGLAIVNVQPSDRGEYDCVWSSSGKSVKTVIILSVVEVPRVIRPPKTSTVAEGGELELSCAVTGQPEPSIEWLINGEPLTQGNNTNTVGTTLFISPVEKKHAGFVQCVASNEYGSYSGYSTLLVTPKQHVGGTTESRPENGPHGTGHNHREHTRDGGRRRGKDGKRRGNAVLVPPNQPEVTRLSDESVMVRWSVPENKGLPIRFFKVQYREIGQKMNVKQSKWMTPSSEIQNHVRSVLVSDLQPNHTYKFRIAAVYSNDDNKLSPNSVRFHLTRNADDESNIMPIPLLTYTQALGPHEVLLLWQNPNQTANIDGFYVYHRASTSAGDYLKTTVEGKEASNITISHLDPDTTYEFKVQSFSVYAASEFSMIKRQKTLKPVLEAPVEQTVAENKPKPVESEKNGSMYAIVGGALGGAILLSTLGIVAVVYKRSKRKQSRESSQTQGKPLANGRMVNGGVTDSKINITSNPLAGLDTSEEPMQPKSEQQSPMEMASFLNGQNNNSSSNIRNNGESTTAAAANVSQVEASLQGSVPNEQPL